MAHAVITAGHEPLRAFHSERSEMLTEFLFGELLEFDETYKDWIRIPSTKVAPDLDLFSTNTSRMETLREKQTGWIRKSSVTEVDDRYVADYMHALDSGTMPSVHERAAIVRNRDAYGSIVIPLNSMLPGYSAADPSAFIIGGDHYEFCAPYTGEPEHASCALPESDTEEQRNAVRRNIYRKSMAYIGAPYRWRGLTPDGIDSEGLVYSILHNNVMNAPFTYEECIRYGTTLSFIEEASVGDILLFSDGAETIIHSGIYLGGGRVIHASGRVRIDPIDHQGVFNSDLKRYTHTLALIVSLF